MQARRGRMAAIGCAAGLMLIAVGGAPGARAAGAQPAFWTARETPAEHDQRMQWFREARFGMFIHWGLYSQLAGEWKDKTVGGGAEWIQKYLEIPSSEYSRLARTWNPTRYDPRAWVRLMKAAGVRYVCITTKHHDGFCLWPTAANKDWNIAVTPYGKDLLQPLADACREEGIIFCLYHSILDWHHSDWPVRPEFNDYAKGAPDKERYKRDYLYPQLKELFTRYGRIGMLWLDGTWDGAWTSEDGKALEDYIRALQPSVVLNNRSGYKPPQPKLDFEVGNAYSYTFAGDYISPEGEVPPTGLPGIDWETCQTMQLPNNWGYNRTVGFRPFADLLRQLVDVCSKGGNLLLNIGPTADGEILPQAAACLEKYAAWMAINSESIHGTTATPFADLPFEGRCTRKGSTLYLHVFKWPDNGTLQVPVRNRILRARLLANPGARLPVRADRGGATLTLPPAAPDPIDSVIAVEIDGEPQVIAPAALLSQGKPVEVSGEWPGREELLGKAHVNDGRFDTIWAGPENSRDGWVQLDLGSEVTADRAVVSEGREYARCNKFQVQAEVAGEWKTVAEGAGIGPRKSVSFAPVTARRFRLTLAVSQPAGAPDGEPVLGEFQLFGQAAP